MQHVSTWSLLAAGMILASCLLLTACNGKDTKTTTALPKEPPPATVVKGEPLQWRELASMERDASIDRPRPGVVVGEFTKDRSDDVLLIDWLGDTKVIQPSGKVAAVKNGEIWPAIFPFMPWDYNRDGIDEVVPTNFGLIWTPVPEGTIDFFGLDLDYYTSDPDFRKSSRLKPAERGDWTPVLDYRGHLLIQLSSGDSHGAIVPGDYDGDGWQDLALEEGGLAETIRVYGGIGQRLGTWEPRMKPECPMSGDIDGDGRDEFLVLEGSRIAVYAYKKERTDIQGWPIGELPSYAADVNGDGKADIMGAICELEAPGGQLEGSEARSIVLTYIEAMRHVMPNAYQLEEWQRKLKPEDVTKKVEYIHSELKRLKDQFTLDIAKFTVPHGGVFYTDSGTFCPFQFPENVVYPYNMFMGIAGEFATIDLDRDGSKEIVAKASVGSAIFVFNQQGELKYYEEFGQPATEMAVAHTANGDVLILHAGEKLLAYP